MSSNLRCIIDCSTRNAAAHEQGWLIGLWPKLTEAVHEMPFTFLLTGAFMLIGALPSLQRGSAHDRAGARDQMGTGTARPAGRRQARRALWQSAKKGLFVMRLKLPTLPHSAAYPSRPRSRYGDLRHDTLGDGETADDAKAQTLPAGSFFALPPAWLIMPISKVRRWCRSYRWPWGITYVNRKTTRASHNEGNVAGLKRRLPG